MSELEKITLTAFLTALLGIGAFVLGQIIQRLFIEPIQEFNRTRGRIASAIMRHRAAGLRFSKDGEDAPPDPLELRKSVSNELHSLAGDISGCAATIPLYSKAGGLLWFLRLPSRKNLNFAIRAMESWASALNCDFSEIGEFIDTVDKHLKLDVLLAFDHTRESRVAPARKALSRSRMRFGEWIAELRERSKW